MVSCEEQPEPLLKPTESSLIDVDAVKFAQENLKSYGKSILSFQTEIKFKKDLYSLIEESFDGERNVLFKTLLQEEKNPINSRNLTNKLNKVSPTVLNAFDNIAGKNYFPQVFIPFYDVLKEKRKLSVKPPIVVIYTNDSPNSFYQGYSLDSEDNLIEIKELISEEYAKENEVWVISINERVDNNGNPLAIYEKNDSNSGRTMASPSAIVDQMKCKCHKESWTAGASEVNIITIASDFGFFEYDINLYGKGDNEGGEIYKFSRSDVSNNRNKDLNFYIVNDWDERAPNKPYGSYVIFEYDTWPTGKRTASWELGGATLNWEYRSADGYYAKQTVFKTNFAFHNVNNDCIEWSSQYQ